MKQKGIIIKSVDYGESDKIITILNEHGAKVPLMVRRAKKVLKRIPGTSRNPRASEANNKVPPVMGVQIVVGFRSRKKSGTWVTMKSVAKGAVSHSKNFRIRKIPRFLKLK